MKINGPDSFSPAFLPQLLLSSFTLHLPFDLKSPTFHSRASGSFKMLGKRARGPTTMRRTASMTGINVEVNKPYDSPRGFVMDGAPPGILEDLQGREGRNEDEVALGGPSGMDHRRLMAFVSPRYQRTRRASSSSAGGGRGGGDHTVVVETVHFLRTCGLCKRSLAPGRDIYMYRGDTAFCSLECREQQMKHDERKEKCSLEASTKDENLHHHHHHHHHSAAVTSMAATSEA